MLQRPFSRSSSDGCTNLLVAFPLPLPLSLLLLAVFDKKVESNVTTEADKTLRLAGSREYSKVLSDLVAFEQRVPADSSASERPLYEETRQVDGIETRDSTCFSQGASPDPYMQLKTKGVTNTTTGIRRRSYNKVLGYKLSEQ